MGTELERSICDKPVLLSLYKRMGRVEKKVREDNAIIETIIILLLTFAVKNIFTFEGMNTHPLTLCYSVT